jgi:dTDP-4-dehydrorhamnose reductase
MRTVVIGATGQLGSDIMRVWPRGDTIGLGHNGIEITDRDGLLAKLREGEPELVVSTAAFHNVDLCEAEPERAFQVNAAGTMYLADACRELGAALMFISTDYVFSGDLGHAYSEKDETTPVNVYGVSKAAGERLVRTRLDEHYIVRTSGLYGEAGSSGKGGNFVQRMLELGRAGKDLRVVDDQVLSPTFTLDLAGKLLELGRTGCYGTYHVTNAGACSWHEFTRKIFSLTGTEASLSRTTTAEFGAKARRPPYSVLENAALAEAGLPPLRAWQEALADYLLRKGEPQAQRERMETRR